MATREIEIPEDVEVDVGDRKVEVSGENGKLEREFNSASVRVEKKDGKIFLRSLSNRRKDRAELGTFSSHIENMLKGVQEDFKYRLKVVYSHFPIKVDSEGEYLIIDNFLGEESPRRVRVIGEETELEVSDDVIIVRGLDKEAVSQTAANIQQETHIQGKDPRIFQDGIYVTEGE